MIGPPAPGQRYRNAMLSLGRIYTPDISEVDRKNKLHFRKCPITRIPLSRAAEWGKTPRTGGPTKIVALTKRLIESGIPEEKVDKMEANSKQRIESLIESCGLAK